jgi:hypothetical protein
LTNLNSEDQCVSEKAPDTCNEDDIKCIVLANKCFLDDEGCVRAALEKVPTSALEKYAAANRLDFAGSSYGRYIRISAPNCKKRMLASAPPTGAKRLLLQSEEETEPEADSNDSDVIHDEEDTTVDADTLFAKQPPLVFGLTSKFWKQSQLVSLLISHDANNQDRMIAGRRLLRGMRLTSPNGQCRAEVQTDGNWVVYKSGNQPIWNSKTSDLYALILKPDGSLCGYRADGSVAWGCDRWVGGTNSDAFLSMQNDCNLVLYRDGGKGVAWSTGTAQQQQPQQPQNFLSALFNPFHAINAAVGAAKSQTSSQTASDRTILSDVRDTVFRAAKPDFQGQVANLNFPSTDKAFAGSPYTTNFLAQF